jgi:hypothetical protein
LINVSGHRAFFCNHNLLPHMAWLRNSQSRESIFDPFDCRTWADIEQFGCLASSDPAFNLAQSPACECQQSMPPAWFLKTNQYPLDSSFYGSLGIPRFYSAGTCSVQPL